MNFGKGVGMDDDEGNRESGMAGIGSGRLGEGGA